MKTFACAISLALCASFAVAGESTPSRAAERPDIAKVVSIDVPAGGCNVVEAKMAYLDSKGESHVMTYLRHGSDCFDH